MPEFENLIIKRPEDQELLMCFDSQPLKSEYFNHNYLAVIDINMVDDKNHKIIIKKILIGEDYWRSDLSLANDGFSAFFHGYWSSDNYEKFKNLMQKLNLAMRFIYRQNAEERTLEERLEIDRLLCKHLEKMDESNLFGYKKLVGINRALRTLEKSLTERDVMKAREKIRNLEQKCMHLKEQYDEKIKQQKKDAINACQEYKRRVDQELEVKLSSSPSSVVSNLQRAFQRR